MAAERRWNATSALFLGSSFPDGALKPPFYLPTVSGTAIDFNGHVDTNDAQVLVANLCIAGQLLLMADQSAQVNQADMEAAQCICDTQSPTCSSGPPIRAPQPQWDECPAP